MRFPAFPDRVGFVVVRVFVDDERRASGSRSPLVPASSDTL
jgi:hypothetical protein